MRRWLLLVGSYPFQCQLCQSRLQYTLGQCLTHAQSEPALVDFAEGALRQVPRSPIQWGFLVQFRWLADRHHRLSCNFPGYTTLFLCHSTHKNFVVLCLVLLHKRVRLVSSVALSTIDHPPGISHAHCHLYLLSLLVADRRNLLARFQSGWQVGKDLCSGALQGCSRHQVVSFALKP